MWCLKFDVLLQSAIPWSRKVGPDGFLLALQLSKKSFGHCWGLSVKDTWSGASSAACAPSFLC